MYEFIRGPLAWTSFCIMVAGIIFQIVRFFILSKKDPFPKLNPTWMTSQPEKLFTKSSFSSWMTRLKLSILGVNPVMIIVTTIFHVTIIVMPILILAHNTIMDQLWGFSLCPITLSRQWTDVLSFVVFGCLLFFVFRRLLLRRVRAINSFSDFLILLLVATPFATGLLAIHEVYDYKTIIIIHILSVEIIMVTIPFTKFVHMLFFFLNRFFIRHEYGFGSGSRRW